MAYPVPPGYDYAGQGGSGANPYANPGYGPGVDPTTVAYPTSRGGSGPRPTAPAAGQPSHAPSDFSNQIIAAFAQAGVDTSLPEVIQLAHQQFTIDAFRNSTSSATASLQWQSIVAGQAQAHPDPAQMTPYHQAMVQLGADQLQDPQALRASAANLAGLASNHTLPGGQNAIQSTTPAQVRKDQGNYQTTDSGGVLYNNGVLFDSNTGSVYFPPNKEVAGSPIWIANASKSWDEQTIQNWRHKLVQMGYLDPAQENVKTFDVNLQGALSQFYQAKYQNYGHPIAGQLNGADATPIDPLQRMHAQITNDVRSMWNQIFGTDPDPETLKRWTQMTIKAGNRMQRSQIDKGTPITGDQAYTQQSEKLFNRLSQSPAGQYEADYQKRLTENTDLHDSLLSAVQASSVLGS